VRRDTARPTKQKTLRGTISSRASRRTSAVRPSQTTALGLRYSLFSPPFARGTRDEVGRFRGREVDTAGDGYFATFDGPARAIRCAQSIRDAVAALGLVVRTGLHTGECEVSGEKVAGIAVHIGARVAASAAPGEILVSGTVKDLVAGSGLRFEDRGARELKGMPGEWRLYAVAG
jgi:class 3 adenylate cyclase